MKGPDDLLRLPKKFDRDQYKYHTSRTLNDEQVVNRKSPPNQTLGTSRFLIRILCSYNSK